MGVEVALRKTTIFDGHRRSCFHALILVIPLTAGPLVLDGDEGLGQALRLSSHAVVGVRAAVLAAHGPVSGVALDGVAGAAGAQLFHHTHRVEQTLFLTVVWEKG